MGSGIPGSQIDTCKPFQMPKNLSYSCQLPEDKNTAFPSLYYLIILAMRNLSFRFTLTCQCKGTVQQEMHTRQECLNAKTDSGGASA